MRKLLFALTFIFGLTTAHATVYYVDSAKANNTGAGTSWATAKKDIQNAIALAVSAGDEVWVKKGTYKPTVMVPGGTVSRDMSFQVTDGIKLYGGFAGTETLLTQRNLNLTANRTILSGDIGNVNDTSDNSRHVIVTSAAITNNTTIDGFTITKGVATPSGFVGVFYRAYGGGLHNLGSPVLSNLIFTENFADFYGGGMYNIGTPTMTNITFDSNYSVSQGGALVNLPPGNLNMSNCTFAGNRSESFGGAILNASTMTLNGASFSGNSSLTGGAIHSQGTATITNARFKGNSTSGEGGAISNYTAPIYISNAVFSDNFTGNFSNGGGALSTRVDTLSVLSNVIFTRNSSSNGSAVRIYGNGKATFNNCTVFKNTSFNYLRGGAIYIDPTSGAAINNCILWNNTTTTLNVNSPHREEIFSDDTIATKIQVKNSIVRDATGSPLGVTNTTFTNCSNKDPMFVNSANPIGTDSIGMTSDDGLALLSCSPAINTGGATTPVLPADILGNNRVGNYDKGAYEFQGAATQPILAAATISVTANQLGTTTYGNCAGIVATIAAGAQTSTIAGSTTTKVYVQSTAANNNGQPYVRRYYDITPATNANTATANITLYFSQADFTNYNSNNGTTVDLPTGPADAAGIGNLRISQQHGTSATGAAGTFTGWTGTGPASIVIDPADTDIIWNSAASRWEVSFPVTGFSGFFAHASSSVPLPVKLISFTAQPDGKANRLEWAASIDDPTSTFTIERSGNGYDFNEIGMLAANRSSYVFYDDQPLSPISYYRLRISEAGEMIYYSKILSVRRDAATEGVILITPVPAHDVVTITCTDLSLSGTDTKVYNTTGQMMMSFRLSESSKIDLTNWAPGVYSLHFANGTIKRLIKR
ncbi:MAG: T9SS type A sorting domain-containing protein [Taibaiella sp.]|jgi:predicted outer membrane repeat protein